MVYSKFSQIYTRAKILIYSTLLTEDKSKNLYQQQTPLSNDKKQSKVQPEVMSILKSSQCDLYWNEFSIAHEQHMVKSTLTERMLMRKQD